MKTLNSFRVIILTAVIAVVKKINFVASIVSPRYMEIDIDDFLEKGWPNFDFKVWVSEDFKGQVLYFSPKKITNLEGNSVDERTLTVEMNDEAIAKELERPKFVSIQRMWQQIFSVLRLTHKNEHYFRFINGKVKLFYVSANGKKLIVRVHFHEKKLVFDCVGYGKTHVWYKGTAIFSDTLAESIP